MFIFFGYVDELVMNKVSTNVGNYAPAAQHAAVRVSVLPLASRADSALLLDAMLPVGGNSLLLG